MARTLLAFAPPHRAHPVRAVAPRVGAVMAMVGNDVTFDEATVLAFVSLAGLGVGLIATGLPMLLGVAGLPAVLLGAVAGGLIVGAGAEWAHAGGDRAAMAGIGAGIGTAAGALPWLFGATGGTALLLGGLMGGALPTVWLLIAFARPL